MNFGHFKTATEKDKVYIQSKEKSKNTNDATRLWMNCFGDYLVEKGLQNEDTLSNKELAGILENFYCELSKKKVNPNNQNTENKYKTLSLRCMRAALARHFKATRSVDIDKVCIRNDDDEHCM